VAVELERIATTEVTKNNARPPESVDLRRAVLAGYPDRVAQRRQPGSPSLRLASGAGAVLSSDSGVRDAEFLVAVDVHAAANPNDPDARVHMASGIDPGWLEPTRHVVEHRLEPDSGRVRAYAIDFYDALVLNERIVPVDAGAAARLIADAWLTRGPRDDDARLVRRAEFAGRSLDLPTLVLAAAYGVRSVDALRLETAVPPDVLHALDKEAPDAIVMPSGRRAQLQYGSGGRVSAAVKLQELFGLAETPRIGKRREPLVLELLAPNGRPVQVTRDLKSFWERTYPEVRKELRGRYPRHPWPDDPLTAPPTARTKKRV